MTVDELLVELSAAVAAGDLKRSEKLLRWARKHLTPEDHARIVAFASQKAAHGSTPPGSLVELFEEFGVPLWEESEDEEYGGES